MGYLVMKSTLSQAIVSRRKELNLTQEKLAESSNLSINYISRIERGTSSHISAISLYKIANALNMPMEVLMGKVTHSAKIPGPNQASLKRMTNWPICRNSWTRISNYFSILRKKISIY
jgi:transcriptional regulator with XRE-family HTH domain